MCQAKTTIARPVQGQGLRSPAPQQARRMVDGLEALDHLQLWPTRRLRMAFLTQAKPLAA